MSARMRVTDGYSLIEALVGLSITLVVVGFLLHSGRMVEFLNAIDVRNDAEAAMATWAFDEIAHEIARTGYGIDGAIEVLPFLAEDPIPASNVITLRSNPRGSSACCWQTSPRAALKYVLPGPSSSRSATGCFFSTWVATRRARKSCSPLARLWLFVPSTPPTASCSRLTRLIDGRGSQNFARSGFASSADSRKRRTF